METKGNNILTVTTHHSNIAVKCQTKFKISFIFLVHL